MAITIRNSEIPLTLDKVVDIEKRLKLSLPLEYKDFIMKHNGGRPKPSGFHYKHETGRYTDSRVDWFLAIYDGESDNFEDYFNTYKVDQVRLPIELVPIANDPGGNLVCISVKGKNKGAVYFWDHENEAGDNETPSYQNVHLLADSFSEFLESLKDD